MRSISAQNRQFVDSGCLLVRVDVAVVGVVDLCLRKYRKVTPAGLVLGRNHQGLVLCFRCSELADTSTHSVEAGSRRRCGCVRIA